MIPTLALANGVNAQLITNVINEYDQGYHLAFTAANSLARRWIADRQDAPVIEALAPTLRWALWSMGATGAPQDGPAVTDAPRIARALGDRAMAFWLRLVAQNGLALFEVASDQPTIVWKEHDQKRALALAKASLQDGDAATISDHQAVALGLWHCCRMFADECFYGTNQRLLFPLRALQMMTGIPAIPDQHVRKGLTSAGASGFTALEMTHHYQPSFTDSFGLLYQCAQFAAAPGWKVVAEGVDRSKFPGLRAHPARVLEILLGTQGRKERKLVEFQGWRDQWQVGFLGFAKVTYREG
ncbi:MAG: hypothetical protein H0W83_11520 [Planctomycetes bacterium]|nr:hypothetical protein [Planctomycetota bacterium]